MKRGLKKLLSRPGAAARAAGRSVLKAFGHRDFVRFIILSRSRTGSNMLVSCFNSHPNVYCEGEIFSKADARVWRETLASVFDTQPRHVKAAGFKIFYYHAKGEAGRPLWDELRGMKELRVIHLRRRNILRTIISRKLAGQNDEWLRRSDGCQGRGAGQKLALDPAELAEGFRQTREWEQRGAEMFSGHPMLDLCYEDFVVSPEAAFKPVTALLGVEYRTPVAETRKQNTAPLSALVVNYTELKSCFAGTEWAVFFDE